MMAAEIYRGDEWIELVHFETMEVHKSGRVILNGVVFVKKFEGSPIPIRRVVLPADVTMYIGQAH